MSAKGQRNNPSVYFRSIVFSDETHIDLEPTDVVVLVGPNNAGKSLALRELDSMLQNAHAGKVICSVKIAKNGTLNELLDYIREHTDERFRRGGEKLHTGYNIQIYESNIQGFWQDDNALGDLTRFFCMRLETEDRISGSNPASSYNVLEETVFESNSIVICERQPGKAD